MKAAFCLTMFVVLMSSCKKESAVDLPEDKGCIERKIVPASGHSISNADIAAANALFSNNRIDNQRYRYYQYFRNSLQTYYPPYAVIDEKVVKVQEYTNGLPIFTGQLSFLFQNDVFHFRSGNPTNGTSLNAVPALKLSQLRKLFIDNAEQFEHKGGQYKDSCLKAEFGYFNLNAGTSYASESLIKAWAVTLKGSVFPSEYPIAYYRDDNGKLIYYDNGIETFTQ